MTDETNVQMQAGPAEAPHDGAPMISVDQIAAQRNAENLARAKANGYQEPQAPSLSDRAHALVAAMEHAMANNGPVTSDMLSELRALLGVSGE